MITDNLITLSTVLLHGIGFLCSEEGRRASSNYVLTPFVEELVKEVKAKDAKLASIAVVTALDDLEKKGFKDGGK